MADPVLGAENPPGIGMADEPHAHQIVNFSLVPIGRAPNAAHGRYFRQFAFFVVFPAGQHHLEHQRAFVRQAPHVIDHLQMYVPGKLFGFFFVGLKIIDSADAVQQVKLQARLVVQMSTDLDQSLRRNLDPRIDRLEVGAGDRFTKTLFQLVNEIRSAHVFNASICQGFRCRIGCRSQTLARRASEGKASPGEPSLARRASVVADQDDNTGSSSAVGGVRLNCSRVRSWLMARTQSKSPRFQT